MTDWLNHRAHAFVQERLCNVWVLAKEDAPENVCAYFTLASHQILTNDVTKRHRKESNANANLVAQMPALLMYYVYEKFLESSRASAAKFLVLETNRDGLVQYYQHRHGFTPSPSNEAGKLVRMYKRAADIETTYEQVRQNFITS